MPTHPDMTEEEKRQELARSKVARSQIAATPIQQATQGMGAPLAQARGASPLQQAGLKVGSKLLGSALGGPLGGILGGLFNLGGKVPMQGYNTGGETNRFGRKIIKKPARTKTTGSGGSWWPWQRQKKNIGGMMMPLNPNGYNEGGAAQPTPIKKEMDIDKMKMAREAFELEQGRKDMQMMRAMALKQDAHDQSMKLKKESATMQKPLAKKE